MGCFQTEADVVVLMALASVAIAVWAALLPQYAFISWAAGAMYYHVAVRWLEPLCEWRRYYYAVFAAGGVASIAAYIYALDAAARYESNDRMILGRELSPWDYAFWMSVQWLCIFFTMLLTPAAHAFALKNLHPSKEHPPNKYPQLPASRNNLDHSVEMLSTTDDVCALRELHSGLQRLICRSDVSAADDLPNYALIIAAYYVLFRRHDPSLAEKLLHVLRGRDMTYVEENAVKVLEASLKAVATCDARAVCKVAATDWAALFKELVLLHFAYDEKAAMRLKCKIVKAFSQYEVYERERGWYIEYVPDPRLYFMFHAVDRALPVCQPQK
jgi:hypothetical protein